MNPRKLILLLILSTFSWFGWGGNTAARALERVEQGSAAIVEQEIPGEILVGVRPESEGPGVSATLSALGAEVYNLPEISVHYIKLKPGLTNAEAIAQLSQHPEIRYAEPNRLVPYTSVPNDPFYNQQYAPRITQTEDAWDNWAPQQQIIIAVCDTGVDNNHPDLVNKILRDDAGNVLGYNTITHQQGEGPDTYGHGTHCAGIAAAQVNNGIGVAGVAGWDGTDGSDTDFIKIMPVKLSTGGSLALSNIIEGVRWAAANGANVLTNSYGGTQGSQAENDAFQFAYNSGCVIVASAGNAGNTTKNYPAAFDHVVSVASTTSSDTISSFSTRGSWVLIAAPGSSIYSTYPGNRYATLSGTSMSGPFVAGAAALVWSQNAGLGGDDVVSILLGTADNINLPISGGRVNVYSALLAATP